MYYSCFREISTTELRGNLGVLFPAFVNSGFLVMFILGAILPWRLATLPGAILPLVPVVLVYFIPETPAWLLSRLTINDFYINIKNINRGRMEDATNTLCRLRGLSASQVQEELDTLIAIEKKDHIVKKSLSEKLRKLQDKTVLKPMTLLVFLFFTQSFSGSNMISYYMVTILQV